jgi:hypothetical protein
MASEKQIREAYRDAMNEEINLMGLEGQRRTLDEAIRTSRAKLVEHKDKIRIYHTEIDKPLLPSFDPVPSAVFVRAA